MAIVGIRSELHHYVDYWTPDQMHVLDVRPGIKLYLEYEKKHSFCYDISLIIKTFEAIVSKKSINPVESASCSTGT